MAKKQMVSVFPIRQVNGDWQHLLIKRATRSYNWQCVTGGVENDETPIQAAFRELYEETGYQSVSMIPYSYSPDFFIDDEGEGERDDELFQQLLNEFESLVFITIIDDLTDPVLDPKEHTGWKWCSYQTAYDMIMWSIEKKQLRIIRDFIYSSAFPSQSSQPD